jgi:hypothetical protein
MDSVLIQFHFKIVFILLAILFQSTSSSLRREKLFFARRSPHVEMFLKRITGLDTKLVET